MGVGKFVKDYQAKLFPVMYTKILKNISKKVFRYLEVFEGESFKIRQVNEDGISSLILKKLAKLNPSNFTLKIKSLELKEKETGIDFDIWIGEADKKYIRIIVQAKSFLNHSKVTEKYEIDKDQCESIIEYSKKGHESFPLYFFYQHIKQRNIQQQHFSFLKDFKHKHSSITFSSAYSIYELLVEGRTRISFEEIHKNAINKEWKNDAYSLFQNKESNVGLPIYLLGNISPSRVESFQKLIKQKSNILGFFFFFPFDFFFNEDTPFKIHNITANKIEELYGKNEESQSFYRKNLVIINDHNYSIRERKRKIKKFLR